MNNWLSYLAVLLGAFIGAGFASGREVFIYFAQYGSAGYVGITFASACFGAFVFVILFFLKENPTKTYHEIAKGTILEKIVPTFSFLCFCTMVTGMGAFIKQQFQVNSWYGSALGASLCLGLLLKPYHRLKSISMILVPGIILELLIMKHLMPLMVFEKLPNEGITKYDELVCSAISYVGYNMLILAPLLMNYKKGKMHLSEVVGISLGFAISIFSLMWLVLGILLKNSEMVDKLELPLLEIAHQMSLPFDMFYGFVVILAMLTTALSCGVNFLSFSGKMQYENRAKLLCASAFLLSKVGFSVFIQYGYYIFGALGIFQMGMIFVRIRKVKK